MSILYIVDYHLCLLLDRRHSQMDSFFSFLFVMLNLWTKREREKHEKKSKINSVQHFEKSVWLLRLSEFFWCCSHNSFFSSQSDFILRNLFFCLLTNSFIHSDFSFKNLFFLLILRWIKISLNKIFYNKIAILCLTDLRENTMMTAMTLLWNCLPV